MSDRYMCICACVYTLYMVSPLNGYLKGEHTACYVDMECRVCLGGCQRMRAGIIVWAQVSFPLC